MYVILIHQHNRQMEGHGQTDGCKTALVHRAVKSGIKATFFMQDAVPHTNIKAIIC